LYFENPIRNAKVNLSLFYMAVFNKEHLGGKTLSGENLGETLFHPALKKNYSFFQTKLVISVRCLRANATNE
jgi:hypothetical protein